MAKLLVREGSFKILCEDLTRLSAKAANQLIKDAGTTCYQTRDSSQKTPEEFIKMLYQRKHFSVLEHSWFCFYIKTDNNQNIELLGFSLLQANNLFSLTIDKEDNSLFVSGNARMWNEAFKKYPNLKVLKRIFPYLAFRNPVLFPVSCQDNNVVGAGLEEMFDKNKERMSFSPVISSTMKKSEDMLAHIAMTVEFNNHCRGFTHEHVRSRIGSYSQESTRYVDYAKGEENLNEFKIKFILPYAGVGYGLPANKLIEFKLNGGTYKWSPQMAIDFYEAWYRTLRKNGLKPEEARQWLPIGLKSQIVTTYTLKEWRHWFYIRTSQAAHPEIRWSAVRLLQDCQMRWSDLFSDFEVIKTEDGINKAVFHGDENFV